MITISVGIYDKALVEKLQKWTQDTQANVYGPDDTRRLFEIIASNSNDGPIKLPILCLRRKPTLNILNTNRKPLTYGGMTLDANENSSSKLNAIPINIQYQLDIYTRYLEEADQYVRNIVFNIINYPMLPIIIPYNGENLEHNSVIRISDTIEDNSNIPERLISGQFTRLTCNINIDDAYLWDVKVRNNYHITAADIYINNGNDNDFTIENV